MEKTLQPKTTIANTKILPNEEIISNIINSEEFRKKLETISANYTNLKQENVIRNYILERLNEYFFENGDRETIVFAEHPRHNGSRVDLSIIDSKKLDQPSYKIEFKYQFSGDNKNMTDYARIIEKDFELRKSDLFILIIAHWKKSDKKEFDKKWGVSSNLSRFISANEEWTGNIKQTFKTFEERENSKLIEFEKIQIEKPFNMEYYFYVLKRISIN
jgi:hypothetical protein